MKRLIFSALAALPLLAFAQNDQGVVHYEESVKLNLQFGDDSEENDPMMEKMREMMAKHNTRTIRKTLAFNASTSLYQNHEGEEDESFSQSTSSAGNEMEIQVVIAKPDERVHFEKSTNQVTELRDLMGKRFLVPYTSDPARWKLTGKTKEILGYACQQIKWQDTGDVVVAWFAPQLPLPYGPHTYAGAPGMVLEVDINEGERVITATGIDFQEVGDKMVAKPTKGKTVTRDEYAAIEAQKQKEMQEMYGGQGRMIIQRDEVTR